MAEKQVKFKITIDGEQIQLTKDQLEGLKQAGQITAEEFDNLTTAISDTDEELESLSSKIGQVEDKMGDLILKGKQNTKEFKDLQKEAQKLRTAQEDMTIASQRNIDTFAAMPGPIGLIGKTFKDLETTSKLAKQGLNQMGLGFNTLGKAIMTSGVGAIVIILGTLVAALIKAFKTVKPLQDAFSRLGMVLQPVMDIFNSMVDIIAGGLTKAFNWLGEKLAFLTGRSEEFKAAIKADEEFRALEKNAQKASRDLELLGDTYDDYTKRQKQAEIDKFNRLKELREDDTKDAKQKAEEKKMIEERYQRDIQKIIDDKNAERDAKEEERQKELRAKRKERLEREKDFQNRLLGLEQEYALLLIEDEQERAELALKQQLDNEIKEYDQLKISTEKKNQLKLTAEKIYQEKLADIREKAAEEARLKEEEQEKQRVDKILGINQDYAKRLEDLEDDTELKRIERQKQRALAELERLGATEEEKLNLIKYYTELRLNEESRLQKEANDAKLQAEKEYNDLVIQAKNQLLDATIAAAGEETKIGRALAAFKALMAFQETMIELKRISFKGTKAVAEAGIDAASNVSASSKIGFPQNLITIAAAIAQGVALVAAVKSAVSAAKGGGTGGGATGSAGGGITSSRGYERGGMIGGRRHAQGGTMIEAEAGEAIINRNSVAMFGPMLSMMNQMGGGVAFSSNISQSSHDNPKTANYRDGGDTPIIKTYVVEQELTTSQQQAARLKDLSTL